MGSDPITSFFGNMLGISDTAGNARRDAEARGSTSLPATPIGAEATSAEKTRIRKKTKTILTSPLIGTEDYGSSAPTLLGSGDTTKKVTFG